MQPSRSWIDLGTFSIRRMLLAIAVLGAIFAYYRRLGVAGWYVGCLVGIPAVGIVLLARRRHLPGIWSTVRWSGMGMLVGFLLTKLIPLRRQDGDEYDIMIMIYCVAFMNFVRYVLTGFTSTAPPPPPVAKSKDAP